ncbi:MAG: hypothetical protein AABW80_01095 [Nanoarchaeota archaeon]
MRNKTTAIKPELKEKINELLMTNGRFIPVKEALERAKIKWHRSK